MSCSNPVLYSRNGGGICSQPLEKISFSRNCPLNASSLTVIQNRESNVRMLESGLLQLQANAQCMEEALPFFCLFLFGLCENSEAPIQPTRSECERLQNSICRREWITAKAFRLGHILPNCSSFPEEKILCHNNGSNSSKGD